MKITILTQYYTPETGAPQNRLSSLASHLSQKGIPVKVLTAMPNYPKMEIFENYRGKLFCREKEGDVKIYRVWLFTRFSDSKLIRLLNYCSFMLSSLMAGLFIVKRKEIILCESPPLFLGITAVILSKVKGCKLIFNVSDLWPEGVEKVGLLTNKTLLKLLYRLEAWIYRNSFLLSGQTQGIVKALQIHKPHNKVFWLRNGVDFSYFSGVEIKSEFRSKHGFSDNDFLILYAGVLGFAQNLNVIIETAAKLNDKPNIKFIIMGDGPEKANLFDLKKQLKTDNVIFIPNTPRTEMPSVISSINAAVIPLKKIELFLGAIPSKIFEALAYKKPILLGVDGEARKLFIDEGKCGLFFEPENANDLVFQTLKLTGDPEMLTFMGENGYKYVKEKFDRGQITNEFIDFIKPHLTHK